MTITTMTKRRGHVVAGGVTSLSRTLARVMVAAEISTAPMHDALPRSLVPRLDLVTACRKEGSAEGFSHATQAAGNGHSHGHNDSGSFIIFRNGELVFIDVGPEAYTATTFSKDRYTLWTMQSAYHNLPTIGGIMQHDGAPYRASDLKYELRNPGRKSDLEDGTSLHIKLISKCETRIGDDSL